MRSRYTAYAVGNVAHLLRSTHPGGPHHQADRRVWADSLRRYCAAVDFTGLTVHEASLASGEGRVAFTARYEHAGTAGTIEEHSRFLCIDGRWLYWGVVEGEASAARSVPEGDRPDRGEAGG